MRGVVKWFNDSKGFGFITTDRGDVFVHYTDILMKGFKTLKEGDEVEFQLYEGYPPGKLLAKEVQKV